MRGIRKIFELDSCGMLNQRLDENEKDHQLQIRINKLAEESASLTNTMQNLSRSSKAAIENFKDLLKEVEILKGEYSQPDLSLFHHVGKLSRDVEDLKGRLQECIADMDWKLRFPENLIANGELIWKIEIIDMLMERCRMEKMVVCHSAPCYTKPYGYKFCSRLYLQGDGMGRSTYISFYFVVMKSCYDQLLNWPMHKQITFKLINHVNDAESIVARFISNPNSSSFQRPTSEMNIASECSKGISIERLLAGGFVVKNCAFIKTTVVDLD